MSEDNNNGAHGRRRVAIVGGGVSGLVCAHILHRRHEVDLFEANDYIGGHTHTIDVERAGRRYAVDTGFIVFNECNYPNFTRLLDQLGVESQPAPMSFSVRVEPEDVEYSSRSLNSLFARRRNIVSPSFHRMVRDIMRFNREAPRLLYGEADPTLGEYLDANGYSDVFRENHILPMGAALWSAPVEEMHRFPARFFVRFFVNHRFLQVRGRTPWRVVRGGSRSYVDELIRPFADRVKLSCPVRTVRRLESGVEVETVAGERRLYDAVVMASHSDQSLRLLSDPTQAERQVLGAIGYQRNEVVLHTDESVLPRRRRAWASWNYRVDGDSARSARVTYNMNMLQSIEAPETFCVTLNDDGAIDPGRVLGRYVYHHPHFTLGAVEAQRRLGEINGTDRVFFCGAYWGFGFHEDGVNSALEVGRHFGEGL